jgi:hypothetical protein
VPDDPGALRLRPEGVDDATVAAVGRLSEAFEAIEIVRGHLYELHRMTGTADLTLGDAVDKLRAAGHAALADRLDDELVGRNVLAGRWTFQVVEEYDAGYYSTFRELEALVRDELMGGQRHVREAEMKAARRTEGRPGHEASP